MTSSNGNFFRVTGHLCGEFTSPRWIPHTKASDAGFWCFFYLRLNKRLSKQSWGWWFETLWCPLWRHRNVLLGLMLRQAYSRRTRTMHAANTPQIARFMRPTPLGKSSRTFFCTGQIFKLLFWDCYKNLAFCNMNCIKQFIIFLIFCVNPLRFNGQ